MKNARAIERIIPSQEVLEGEGFLVHRPFPVGGLSHLDPFLLIDEMGPMDLAPGQAKGAPDHPHRGFQTITYLLEGGFVHRDSAGHASELGPGDVQWMTAGRGVVHSEMPAPELLKNGGRMHGIQIWLNLPREQKMIPPQYQDVRKKDIPKIELDNGLVHLNLIAGELNGAKGPAQTVVPSVYAHLHISPFGEWRSELPANWTVLAYVLKGEVTNGDANHRAGTSDLIQFSKSAGEVVLRNTSDQEKAEVLLLAAEPLGEPIARMGPFVMNTRRELEEAYEDYISGRMGEIAAKQI